MSEEIVCGGKCFCKIEETDMEFQKLIINDVILPI